jgi:curli biogenesis system outer membrane secretion channel CsgG
MNSYFARKGGRGTLSCFARKKIYCVNEKIRGIDAIIVGSATISNGFAGLLNGGYRDYISNCSARLIDVATGEILFAATYSSSRPRNQHGFVTPTDVGEMLAQEFLHIDKTHP